MRTLDLVPLPQSRSKSPLGRAAQARRSRRLRALAISAIALAWIVAVPAVVRPVAAAGDPVIAAAGDIFELAKLYRAGRFQRIYWIARLKAANSGCQAVAPASPTK